MCDSVKTKQAAKAEAFFSVESWQQQLEAEAFFVSDMVETREATEVEDFYLSTA